LEREDEVPSEHETHLLDQHILAVCEGQHLHDEEKIGLVVIQFRALIGIRYVLEKQRMKRKLFSQGFQHGSFVDAADVDPGDRLIARRSKVVWVSHLLFLTLDARVVKGGDSDVLRLLLADMDEGARRKPGFPRTFLD
jgi:hypothetical protein